MKLSTFISAGIVAALLLPASSALSANVPAGARPSDVQHLKQIFRQHVFFGRRFDKRLRAATGDPRIVVFDHRIYGADGSECSFITYRGKRAIVCD